ncbi:hypothetical protein MTR67_008945 [Solanum verrucosum]|uniref:Uncharacterized protein n=1 Tax=Solanum verrucosum TaxID=315347 RepID=A0AAF0Q4R8_SOLVR|nr:hypothetical protein MTR67_008945 [Solanum verrucosum]
MDDSVLKSNEDSVEENQSPEIIEKPSPLQDFVEHPQSSESLKQSSAESVKKSRTVRPSLKTQNGATNAGTVKRRTGIADGADFTPGGVKSSLTKSTVSSTSRISGTTPVTRRSSTGGLPDKQPITVTKRASGSVASGTAKKTNSLATDPMRRSLPEMRKSTLPSTSTRTTTRSSISEIRRSVPVSPLAKTPRVSVSSDASKQESVKRTSAKLSSPSLSSVRRSASTSLESTASSVSTRKFSTKLSSPAAQSPSVSTGSKAGSLSKSLDRSSNSSSRKKGGTPEGRDSRLIMLPQVEIKAGDDVRLDLRGHRIRSLNNGGLNLSPTLEFVYLRDNLLSVLDGIEILTRVKVLDLSFNDFKGPGFEPLENCKALQQLYLAGNQITSLTSLPELPNLEFLSVAQNKLKSLSMASQPRLQVLAASKNKISTLKGFPYLPSLEHLRVEENPILRLPHLEAASILLVGPTLKKFNDRDLSREEIALAKRYPSHTPVCIRGGWEFCRPEQAVDSTFRFLLEQWKEQLPQGFLLKEAFIDHPFEEDACYCHFNFVKDESESTDSDIDLKYQWFIGERTPSNFIEIHGATREFYWPKHEDIGRILKVECTPKLGETEYPTIFAISSPVSPGTGHPKVLKIEVSGDLLEGNIIRGHAEIAWCGGTPGRSISSWLRKTWSSNPVVIVGAEEEEYQLMLDDVGSCLMFMYTPMTEEGAKGEPQYAITDYVKAAPPSVGDVQISGDVVEGNTIRGIGRYFGGKEGPSKFEWLREDKDTGEFVLVSSGMNEYTLTKEDVGCCLAFVYVPVNFQGQEGKSVSLVSQKVKQAPPKVTHLKIIGELKEGSKITVTGIVTGGIEGASRVQWFKTSSSTFEGESYLDALSTSKIAKAFRIPLGAVGYYIVAKFTPMTPDGEAGEPVFVISERAAETLPPNLNFLSLTGDYAEGGIMTASYGYIGGHEGKSIYNWYLHEVENGLGAMIPEFSGLLQYRIAKDAIGKFISFKCTPVRDDGTVGEPKTCIGQERVRAGTPRLLSLRIAGTAVEGTTLSIEKKYWGGEEGDSIYRWFRTSSSGTNIEVNDEMTSSYKVSIDDIGYFISVSCEPVRNDWACGPIVISEQVGPIVPGPPTCHSLEFQGSLVEGERVSFVASYSGGEKGECIHEWFRVNHDGGKDKISCDEFLDLTLEDVSNCIELIYTPIRKDTLKGSCRSILSCPVAPGDPIGVELSIPKCCEGETIVPNQRYFGGKEGDSEYVWYRSKNKLHESALLNLPSVTEDVHICARTISYTPSLEDVGAYLSLYWLPIRIDGKSGNPLASVCESPVSPASPVVSNVHAKELSSSSYLGEGEYFGGHEGTSLFSWYRETDEGTITLINGACSKTYEVVDEDYNCRLLFGYTPVRSDSIIGEHQLSEPTHVILPDIPRIETLALTGKAVEGDILTAVEIIPKSEIQERVWAKYRKDIKYTWFISTETGNNKSFEPLPSQRSCSYRLRFEDIGRSLRCECIVSDVFGRSSDPVYAETPSVSPGIPRMDKLDIEGRGFHTNLYAVRGVYSGGKEGKSKIQWLRSMVGSPDLISIPGETGRMYEANVDDVGYRLVVIYTPVREDGVEGHPVSASTDPIAIGDGHSSASRIDRFLYSSQWDESFTRIKQNLLPRIGSDHNPIMLDCGELNSNKSYFKFEQWWLRVDGFADKIKEWWLSFNINGTGSYILAVKLKMLKQKLKEWRMTHRNDWKRKKEEILQQLAEMEKTQELRLLSEDELLQKVHLAMEFEEVAKQEEIAWRQRSRIQWLKKGDKNTKFFHRVATAHKRFNSIDTLVVEGNSISDPEDIKGEIINFYQKLYTETEQWRPEFKLQGLETITEEERDWLQTHFEEAEVLKCIKSCASDKAPGPDGFPMCFFQSFWEDVIVSKYGQTDSWTSNTVTSTYGVSVWRSIRNLWPKLARNICYKVGEGTRIRFWKDKWIGQNSLMEDFADLYSFCDNPGASIAEMWSQQGWNITLRRLLNDWEVDRVANLLQRLEDFPGLNTNPDAIRWKHDRDGEFSVGRMYKRDLATQPGEIAGPWKQIWKSNTPTKIKCFTCITNITLIILIKFNSSVWVDIEPDVLKEVKQKLETGSVKFEALCDKDQSTKKVPGMGNLERRILEVNKKRVKVVKPGSKTSFPTTEVRGTYAPPFHVELFRNDQHRLRIVVDSESEVDLLVQTRHLRDIVVLVIRGLAQRFNSTSLNSLLKIEN